MSENSSDKTRSEFRDLGFRRGLGQFVCMNEWKDAVRKTDMRCYWESDPANITYLQTLFQKGRMYCPECAKRQSGTTKGKLSITNIKIIPYIPTFITLACSGSIRKTLFKHDGIPYHDVEPCNYRMGTYQLNDAKRQLRSKELKCPECGSRRFHQIEKKVSQSEKLVEVIKSGKFRHLRQYYEEFENLVRDTVKNSFKID